MATYESEEVKPEKLDPVNDVIIALMGPLGSGKSQIIDTLTGQRGRRAGGSLKSGTTSLTAIRVLDHETYQSRLVLIDTPGFDEGTPNRRDIIMMIERWLKQKSGRNVKLAAVIYVHQITDTRTFDGISHFILRRLGELRRTRLARNIVLVTTMWDKSNRKAENEEREEDLKAGYWKIMIQHGASVDRFENSPTSAWAIVDKIVARHDDPRAEDVIIAVVGPTGSGKSDFISKATGEVVRTSADLESCTKEIDTFKVSFPGYNIVFIDTPGFDDRDMSDNEVFKMISEWLEVATSGKGILLSGLLYFHQISDNRMGATRLKNLQQFQDLCGEKGFRNIVLTTTMWDLVDPKTGENRERELSNFWKEMITRGSTIARFKGTRDSAFQVIKPLLDAANDRHQLLLQKEVLDIELELSTTPSGQKLRPRLQAMAIQQRELQNQMLQQLGSTDNAALESSVREYEALKQNPDFVKLLRELKELGIPLGRRFVNMVTMTFVV